jgi:hypothetical protein
LLECEVLRRFERLYLLVEELQFVCREGSSFEVLEHLIVVGQLLNLLLKLFKGIL